MTPTLSASADPSDLERAAAILDDARAENRTGQLIVELAEQDGRSRGLAPERRRAIGEAFLGRFPDVAVTRGTGRIVETVSREGEELIVQADTLYHSFLLIEPPELARLAVLVRDPNVRSVEPEAVHAVAFSAVSPRIPRQSAEVGWHMDSIRAPLEWGTPGTDPVSFATIDTGIQKPWSPPLGTTDIRWNQFVECSEMTAYQDYCYFEHLFHGTDVHSLVNSSPERSSGRWGKSRMNRTILALSALVVGCGAVTPGVPTRIDIELTATPAPAGRDSQDVPAPTAEVTTSGLEVTFTLEGTIGCQRHRAEGRLEPGTIMLDLVSTFDPVGTTAMDCRGFVSATEFRMLVTDIEPGVYDVELTWLSTDRAEPSEASEATLAVFPSVEIAGRSGT
jgi:hypothetical protein